MNGSFGPVQFDSLFFAGKPCGARLPGILTFRIMFKSKMQNSKKRLADGVIVRHTRSGKRLPDIQIRKQSPESIGCILCPLIAVKDQILRVAAILIGYFEGGCDETGSAVWGNLIGDDFAREQIKDCTNVIIYALYHVLRTITDPDFIGTGNIELPL